MYRITFAGLSAEHTSLLNAARHFISLRHEVSSGAQHLIRVTEQADDGRWVTFDIERFLDNMQALFAPAEAVSA